MGRWSLDQGFDVDALKEAVDLLEVIESYGVDGLRPSPHGIRGACPLCLSESRDPFVVYEELQRWVCHKCHRRGSVIDFVMYMEKLEFMEAAFLVKERVGDLPLQTEANRVAKKAIRKVRKWNHMRSAPPPLGDENVPQTIPLREGYRHLSSRAISHWGLRRIPGFDWACGCYIPMRSPEGVLVGYTIRQIPPYEPKYLNSTGLARDRIVYGLWENRQSIHDHGCVVLVEGQFDAIRTWDRGVENVAAILGSALTHRQATALMKYTTHLVLAMDGDEAGKSASSLITETWGGSFDIDVIQLPAGQDPDSYDISEQVKEKIDGIRS